MYIYRNDIDLVHLWSHALGMIEMYRKLLYILLQYNICIFNRIAACDTQYMYMWHSISLYILCRTNVYYISLSKWLPKDNISIDAYT